MPTPLAQTQRPPIEDFLVTFLCIWPRNILRNWFMTTVLTLPTHVLQPRRILYGFSVMIQKQFFRVFQLFAQEVKYFYQKNTWKNPQIVFNKWKWFKTWNNFGKEFASQGVEAAYIARIIFFIYSGLKGCVWLLLVVVAVTLLVTSASCKRRISNMKLVKTFPRNSMTSERLGNINLLSMKRVRREKTDLYDFVDEFDSRHDNRRIELIMI